MLEDSDVIFAWDREPKELLNRLLNRCSDNAAQMQGECYMKTVEEFNTIIFDSSKDECDNVTDFTQCQVP